MSAYYTVAIRVHTPYAFRLILFALRVESPLPNELQYHMHEFAARRKNDLTTVIRFGE